MPTVRKPKDWQNGVSFCEDIILPEARKRIVQAALVRAKNQLKTNPRTRKQQEALRDAIEGNRKKLEDGVLEAARRYVTFLNFDKRPLPSEIEARLKELKRLVPTNWHEVEALLEVDDGAAYALRKAAFELNLPEGLEELIEHRRIEGFNRVLDRALANIQAHPTQPGRREEIAMRTLVLELAEAWQNCTGEPPGGGKSTPLKSDTDPEFREVETRSGPFVDFAASVIAELPNILSIPDGNNPGRTVKKHLDALRKARASNKPNI